MLSAAPNTSACVSVRQHTLGESCWRLPRGRRVIFHAGIERPIAVIRRTYALAAYADVWPHTHADIC
jgi:hypothetical protein